LKALPFQVFVGFVATTIDAMQDLPKPIHLNQNILLLQIVTFVLTAILALGY